MGGIMKQYRFNNILTNVVLVAFMGLPMVYANTVAIRILAESTMEMKNGRHVLKGEEALKYIEEVKMREMPYPIIKSQVDEILTDWNKTLSSKLTSSEIDEMSELLFRRTGPVANVIPEIIDRLDVARVLRGGNSTTVSYKFLAKDYDKLNELAQKFPNFRLGGCLESYPMQCSLSAVFKNNDEATEFFKFIDDGDRGAETSIFNFRISDLKAAPLEKVQEANSFGNKLDEFLNAGDGI